MRKMIAVLMVALLAFSLAGGTAAANKKKKKKKVPPPQVVEGGVAMMLPFPLDLSGCYGGVHRRVAILTDEQVNGVTGFHFDVEPHTVGKPFVLEVTGGQADVDLDITFYTEFGTTDDVINDPGGAGAPYSISFEERGPGGEHGKVPELMEKAIVCMYQGADASFTYTAGKGVKLPKG